MRQIVWFELYVPNQTSLHFGHRLITEAIVPVLYPLLAYAILRAAAMAPTC